LLLFQKYLTELTPVKSAEVKLKVNEGQIGPKEILNRAVESQAKAS